MYPAGQWLEIVDVADPWIERAVPADNSDGVVIENIRHQRVVDLDPNLKLPGVAMRHKFLRSPKISIGVRRQLYQLAVVVSVSFGNLDRPRGFDYHEPVVLSIKMDPVRRSSRDDDVVSLVEGEDSEYRF